jgi:prefoldin subunit 5
MNDMSEDLHALADECREWSEEVARLADKLDAIAKRLAKLDEIAKRLAEKQP